MIHNRGAGGRRGLQGCGQSGCPIVSKGRGTAARVLPWVPSPSTVPGSPAEFSIQSCRRDHDYSHCLIGIYQALH